MVNLNPNSASTPPREVNNDQTKSILDEMVADPDPRPTERYIYPAVETIGKSSMVFEEYVKRGFPISRKP